MNETKQSAQNQEDSVTRRAFWGTLVLNVITTLVFGYFFTFFLKLDKTPTIYLALAVFLVDILVSLASIVFTLRGQQQLGAKLTFYTLQIGSITIVSVFQGRTLNASFSILVISAIAIAWLLPSQGRRWYSAITAAAFISMWTIEWLNPSWRVVTEAANVGPIAVAIFLLIFGWILFTQSRRYLTASVSTSLRLQITVWTGAIVAVLSIVILTYSILTSRQEAIASAQAETLAISEAQAGNVRSQIDAALNSARTMSYSLRAIKDPTDPTPMTREQVNAMLRKVAEENPTFLGVWTVWEPNAFDGQDARYANAPLHDASGRFVPYWERSTGVVQGTPIIDYETPIPGFNDWYFIPKETGQETLITPYLYPINGVDVLMTTLALPIVEDGHFYGATGVDYQMDFVQGLVNEIDLYNGTASAALFTSDGTLVAVRNQPELILESATSVYTDFEDIQSSLSAGKPFISLSPDGDFLRVFSPVTIGDAGQWWFSLIIPFSEITAPATALAVREAAISTGVIILSLLVLWYLTGQLVRPILDLTKTANAVSSGDLNAVAKVETENEIGTLASTFNSMTSQLRETLSSLEQRVADRTRNLELAAEVGRSVSQVRALDVMLKDAAELIRSQFDLYYVQVYLTDINQTNLLLLSGTGRVGEQLVGRGHRLPLNTGSINGRAATEKKAVVIADTVASGTFRPNPLLPDTRSEMAIPLIVGQKVVGVLDLQSEKANVLSRELLPAFEALAGQLAIAIQNANLLAEAEQARAEVEAQARRLVRTNWNEYLDAIHKPEETGFVFEQNEVMPLVQAETTQSVENGNLLAAPIEVTGEALGNLVVEMEGESSTARSDELVNTVARQVAQHIEALRLLESAERYRAEAEESSRRLTREGWKTYKENTEESLGYFYDLNEVKPHNGNGHDESAVALPLKVRDEVLGKLAIQGLDANDSQALELVNAVAERLSAHIESLRQFDETRRGQIELDQRAQQLAAVAEISTASSKELDIQKMLESVVNLTQSKFGLYHAHIFTYNEYTDELQITACGWEDGSEHEGTHETVAIPLSREQSLVARAARTRQSIIVNDVKSEPGFLANPLLPDTASEMAVPLIIGDQVLGVLDVQSDQVDAFTEEDANIQTTLASQVATALQNARSFARAQQQAARESTLNVISQKIQSATSVEAVLQIAARELGHALGAPMTVAQLSMKDKS